MNKIKFIVLIAILAAVLITGCVDTQKQETIPNTTVIPTPPPVITPTVPPTQIPITETPGAPKLKIMSVTTGQATLGGIPVIMKVKNVGDAIAKDVYAGAIDISYFPPTIIDKYPDRNTLINESIYQALLNGSYQIDTGFVYTEGNSKFSNLTVVSTIASKDYIGEISPGDIKTAQFTLIVSTDKSIAGQIASGPNSNHIYAKVAWTDDKKEYTTW